MARRLAPYALLLALVLAVFGQAAGFGFVDIDDGAYVTEVPAVRAGLTWESAAWAFTSRHGVAWQPVTWLSHMLDVTWFGMAPGGHHATSVALHAANACLLFAWLASATGRAGPSWLVAALFAVHPLRVESVAWVAERKDVLSTLFALLALHAWLGWTRRGGALRYAACASCLALGLLAKPMLVTLPVLLLLLDHWPLGRLEDLAALRRRAIEKLPLAALGAAASAATLAAQQAAMEAGASLAFGERAANAALAVPRYLAKALWPAGLSVHYPHPYIAGTGGVPPAAWVVAASALLVAALSAAAWRGPRPLRVGWLWFLAGLAPTLGLVQVGTQAMADRYTYLPLVGIFVALCFTGSDLAARLAPRARRAVAGAAAAAVAALAVAAHAEAAHWRDSVALFEHGLAAEPRAATLHLDLGLALEKRGELARAERHYQEALATNPGLVAAWFNLGNVQRARRDLEAAAASYARALALDPDDARAAGNLAGTLRLLGRRDDAARAYAHLLARRPDDPIALLNLASLHEERGDREQAALHYRRALAASPGLAPARTALARLSGDVVDF
jgi:tetratricopeptide (TPR) repeat protein